MINRFECQLKGQCLNAPRQTLFARWCGIIGFLCAITHGQSQGTLQITFDGPPLAPSPGTARIVQNYYEAGMWFRPIDPDAPFSGFVRSGGGREPFPENGTPYLQGDLTSTLTFNNFVDNSLFGVVSVDLAGFSTGVPDFAVTFIGHKPDGTTISTKFSGSGIMFRTFHFDKEWTGLTRVEIPSYGWSLDNLVVIVPEPSVCVLFMTGGILLSMLRNSRKL